MRVIWKDTKQHNEIKQYKSYHLFKEQRGWSVSIPGDDNIYDGVEYACNAINNFIGHKRIGKGKYDNYKPKIIGTTNNQMKKEEGLL